MSCNTIAKFYEENKTLLQPNCDYINPVKGGSSIEVVTQRKPVSYIGCAFVSFITVDSVEGKDNQRGIAIGSSTDRYKIITRSMSSELIERIRKNNVYVVVPTDQVTGTWEDFSGFIEKVRNYGSRHEFTIDPGKVIPL